MTLLLAQGGEEVARDLPWVFNLQSGEKIYGFADTDDVRNPRKDSWKVYRDEPWLSEDARRMTIARHELKRDPDGSVVPPYQEFKQPREKRIAEGWEAHGGIRVPVDGGGEAWVSKAAWEASEQAKRLVESKREVASAHVTEGEGGVVESGRLESTGPGLFTLWGPHALVAALGAAALSVTYIFLVRR